MRNLDPREKERVWSKPNSELEKVHIGHVPEQVSNVGQNLIETLKMQLMSLLVENSGLFALAPKDMPRIDPRVICHILSSLLHRKGESSVLRSRKQQPKKPRNY